jgi:hypothetical protein
MAGVSMPRCVLVLHAISNRMSDVFCQLFSSMFRHAVLACCAQPGVVSSFVRFVFVAIMLMRVLFVPLVFAVLAAGSPNTGFAREELQPLTQFRQQHRRTVDGRLCAAAFVQNRETFTGHKEHEAFARYLR